MSDQNAEALRLADELDRKWWRWKENPTVELKAAAELRRLHAENERLREFEREVVALLPGVYYMDPPDGGSVDPIEQLRRMSEDAERYRIARRKICAIGRDFHILNLHPIAGPVEESIVPHDDEQRQWRDDLLDVAEYLRQCAQSDAVEALRWIIEAANGRQRHNPITDEMHAALRYARAVLAAHGGKDD